MFALAGDRQTFSPQLSDKVSMPERQLDRTGYLQLAMIWAYRHMGKWPSWKGLVDRKMWLKRMIPA